MNKQLFNRVANIAKENVELSAEKVELASDPQKLIDDVREESRKLAVADSGLRDAQTIAINSERRLNDLEAEVKSTMREIEAVLKSEAINVLSRNEVSSLRKQLQQLDVSRGIAGGRASRARAINDAVKKVLNR